MTNISSYTSHRIELEGIFRALHHLDLLNITPKMVEQWCDNKQAVKDSTTTTDGPSMMIKVEADIILAIHHLRNRFPFHTNIKHIYGHQDTKKPKRHIPQDETSQPTKEVDMLIPVWLQTPYGYGESPNGKFFVSLPLSIRGSPYGNGETKWLIILIW
jgi:hypothetical protein